MHGLVDAAHVDHLHPDSGIALATAADGEELTEECFGDRVLWVAVAPARVPARPGHRRGHGAPTRRRSACILGGHGITAWGDTVEECEANSLDIIRTAEAFLAERGAAGAVRRRRRRATSALAGERAARAGRRAGAVLRGLASTDRRQVGHFTDTDVVLDFLAREQLPRLAALGTSCPDHFLRTKVRPLVARPAADRAARRRASPG